MYLLLVEQTELEHLVLEDSEDLSTVKELEEVEGEGLEVSIHVISDGSNNNAMKLHGRIEACSVEILADSRSTHNFLDLLVVQEDKLKVEKDFSVPVRVANGAKVLSQGRCEEVIRIQESKFLIPFHVLT